MLNVEKGSVQFARVSVVENYSVYKCKRRRYFLLNGDTATSPVRRIKTNSRHRQRKITCFEDPCEDNKALVASITLHTIITGLETCRPVFFCKHKQENQTGYRVWITHWSGDKRMKMKTGKSYRGAMRGGGWASQGLFFIKEDTLHVRIALH